MQGFLAKGLALEPARLHFFKKFFCNRKVGTFANNGINSTVRANCCAGYIFDPLLNFLWIEYGETIETAALFILTRG
jgi:hypothetical protein